MLTFRLYGNADTSDAPLDFRNQPGVSAYWRTDPDTGAVEQVTARTPTEHGHRILHTWGAQVEAVVVINETTGETATVRRV